VIRSVLDVSRVFIHNFNTGTIPTVRMNFIGSLKYSDYSKYHLFQRSQTCHFDPETICLYLVLKLKSDWFPKY